MRASRAATSRRAGVCPCPALANPCWVATAVVAVGYDEPQRRFIIRNSWGTSWGMRGYGLRPERGDGVNRRQAAAPRESARLWGPASAEKSGQIYGVESTHQIGVRSPTDRRRRRRG